MVSDPWLDAILDKEIEACAREMPDEWSRGGPLAQFIWINLRAVAKPSAYPALHWSMTGVCPMATPVLLNGKKAVLLRHDQHFYKSILS
jgi:hypothetical protein